MSGERFAEIIETNVCKARKPFREERTVLGSEASSKGLAEHRGAEICQVGGRLCECPGGERQRVCALNEEPSSLN